MYELQEKRLTPVLLCELYGDKLWTIEIDRGRREEEDEWVKSLRGQWARVRTDKKVIYMLTTEFDAMMCKLWFQG